MRRDARARAAEALRELASSAEWADELTPWETLGSEVVVRPPLVPAPPRDRAAAVGPGRRRLLRLRARRRRARLRGHPARRGGVRPAVEAGPPCVPDRAAGRDVRPGEDPEEAAARELREETGYACSELRELGALRAGPDEDHEHDRRLPRPRGASPRARRHWDEQEELELVLIPVAGLEAADTERPDHLGRHRRDHLPGARRAPTSRA